MTTIYPADLQELLVHNPGLALVDVRTRAEFAEVHVPQARNEPLDRLDPKGLAAAGAIAADKPTYLLCRSGARATKAADRFVKEGFEQAVVVEGGTLAWIEAGLPVTRDTTKVISLERQVRIVAGSLVLVGLVLAWVVNPYFLAISGFVGAGLIFAGISDWCGMGLLLAKAPWNSRS